MTLNPKNNQTNSTTLTFHGGAGSVTGSNFLLETGSIKILVDCGLFQGCNVCEDKTRAPFSYDPATIDYLFVTHAHIDHTGRIPKLVKDGFKGTIYSTLPTKELSGLMLMDSMRILASEAKEDKKPPLYSEKDVENSMRLWKTEQYHTDIPLKDNITVSFKDAGHILGSAMIEFKRGSKKLVMTGDLGNSPTPLLKDTEPITDANYLVMESVYGDRNHESRNERKRFLENIIESVALHKGVLLIPAFSVERTQEILFEIEQMVETKQIPSIPVFIDSPLAIAVTDIYKKYDDYFNKDVKYGISSGNEIFSFSQLHLTKTREASKAIFAAHDPKIIIAGSGMSHGGRIVHHEKRYLPKQTTTLLIVGYQAPGSLGRQLQEGAKKVTILGDEVAVNAKVVEARSYSSHKDSDALLRFAEKTIDSVEKVFVVMGEMKSSTFLTQRLRDYLGIDAVAPREGDSVMLDF
ncbi:MBL fold hydrolase [bacterium]|nr:MBL fold hydrolase [bacterium]|tara:strand:+ start:10349 stop:11740 length:1392 start_codon:yes stop_codon:yes gene_type:complete